MTATASAAPRGEGRVGVVISASAILGITVTNSRYPSALLDPPRPDRPGATPSPTILVPLGLIIAGRVYPSSRYHPLTPRVGTFGSGGCTAGVVPDVLFGQVARETVNPLSVTRNATDDALMSLHDLRMFVAELGSPTFRVLPPVLASAIPVTPAIQALIPTTPPVPRASTGNRRFGLGLSWPLVRGVIRSTFPRPSGCCPRDHPTGGGAVVGDGPRAKGTATMHLSVHVQRAHVPSRDRLAIGSPSTRSVGRVGPLMHNRTSIMGRCVPGGEGGRRPP